MIKNSLLVLVGIACGALAVFMWMQGTSVTRDGKSQSDANVSVETVQGRDSNASEDGIANRRTSLQKESAVATNNEIVKLKKALLTELKESVERQKNGFDDDDYDRKPEESEQQAETIRDEMPKHSDQIDRLSIDKLESQFQNKTEDQAGTDQKEQELLDRMEELEIPTDLLAGIKCESASCRVEFDFRDREGATSLTKLVGNLSQNEYSYRIIKGEDGQPEKVVAFVAREGQTLNQEAH